VALIPQAWEAGTAVTKTLVCPVGTASKGGVSSLWFSIRGIALLDDVTITGYGGATGTTAVFVQGPFDAPARSRTRVQLPAGTIAIEVTYTSTAPVGVCLETQ
jgi:hypothetical protein